MVDVLRDIGTYFRQIRESIGLDVDTVARELKIRRAYIVGLEQGDFSSLPDREIYVTGMIRGYATFLKNHAYEIDIDPEALVDRYRAVSDDITPAGDFHFPTMESDASKPKFVMVLFSVICVISFYAYWSNRLAVNDFLNEQIETLSDEYAGSVNNKVEPPRTPTTHNVVAPKASENNNVAPPNKQHADADKKVDDLLDIEEYLGLLKEKAQENMAATANNAVKVQEKIPAVQNNVNQLQEEFNKVVEDQKRKLMEQAERQQVDRVRTPRVEKRPEILDHANRNNNSLVQRTEPNIVSPRQPERQNPQFGSRQASNGVVSQKPNAAIPKIVLMAREDTWVKISDSRGALIVERVMKSGDTYFLPEKNNLVISAGNADAIEVFIDGDEHSFLGTLNDVSRTN